MTTGSMAVRIVLGVVGALMLLGGLAVGFGFGWQPGALLGAAWLILSGAVLVIVALIEVSRYRSQTAETNHIQPGPGGGESAALEPRFRSTDEVFVDPTSRLRMRVFLDPATGERRYVAED